MAWEHKIYVDMFVTILTSFDWGQNSEPQSMNIIPDSYNITTSLPSSGNFMIYLHTSCGRAAIGEERPVSPFHLGQPEKWKSEVEMAMEDEINWRCILSHS